MPSCPGINTISLEKPCLPYAKSTQVELLQTKKNYVLHKSWLVNCQNIETVLVEITLVEIVLVEHVLVELVLVELEFVRDPSMSYTRIEIQVLKYVHLMVAACHISVFLYRKVCSYLRLVFKSRLYSRAACKQKLVILGC